MIEFVNKYSHNFKYSQNGEEGILLECLKRMGITGGNAVEVGGNDGLFCSNTALLIEYGWAGKFIEMDFTLYEKSKENWAHNRNVKCICSRVDRLNVNAFVGDSCDVLSLDTDGMDYQIFKGLEAKPKIVIVEIDSSYPPHKSGFNSDGGATYRTMAELGLGKGYFLLAHTGNLIFVRNDFRELFQEASSDPLINAELYFNRGWLKEEAA